MLRKFKRIYGYYLEKIPGQERFAYARSDQEDLYDLIAWSRRGGYPGSVILFYDFETGDVYQPFEKKRDTIYGQPVSAGGTCYFLEGAYGEGRVILWGCFPGREPWEVSSWTTDEIDLYNLRIVGNGVHVISQNGTVRGYYPEKFEFPISPQETACFIEDGKVYLERWIEEGWDHENDRASEDYVFYHKVVVRDLAGNVLSEELGYLHQAPDGSWWIA